MKSLAKNKESIQKDKDGLKAKQDLIKQQKDQLNFGNSTIERINKEIPTKARHYKGNKRSSEGRRRIKTS